MRRLQNFILYHNADDNGPYRKGKFWRGDMAARKKAIGESAVGNTVWVIESSRVRANRTAFTLVGAFQPQSCFYKGEGNPTKPWRVAGPCVIEVEKIVNNLDWFDDLFAQTANFSIGFTRVEERIGRAMEQFSARPR